MYLTTAYGIVNTPMNLPTVNRPKIPPPLMGGNMDRRQQNTETTVHNSTFDLESNQNQNQENNYEDHGNYQHKRN